MWIRARLDIGWSDFLAATWNCLLPQRREAAETAAMRAWAEIDDDGALFPLSVRSGFDLILRALELRPGDEILFSALTVPDMPRIAQLHGLQVVPVDTNADGQISMQSLEKAITPKSRMLVVAHLFGGLAPMSEINDIAKRHDLFVVEDKAQRFVGAKEEPRDRRTDVVLYSFGPIKTATSLGGAVMLVRDDKLRRRTKEILHRDPVQSRKDFLGRTLKFATLKSLSGPMAAALFLRLLFACGKNPDVVLNGIARGFRDNQLLHQLRKQPSTPLLQLMARRWSNFDHDSSQRKVAMGRYLDKQIGVSRSENDSYWVYPVFVPQAKRLADDLRAAGIDATCQNRMNVVTPIDHRTAPTASWLWHHVVFLPWYPELPDFIVSQMGGLISEHQKQHVAHISETRSKEEMGRQLRAMD
ncbi:MAG: aminotransferase class V-fold PLP-dependent enzyme [Planctomycetales bacterium]|nr:aminotransferase class V-fold PLP-dependent enzyme [Planctomycetales bacterium]